MCSTEVPRSAARRVLGRSRSRGRRRVKRRRGGSARAIAALVAGSALALAPAAQAETTVSQTTPIVQETVNPCTREPVTLTGTAHYTIQYSETVGTTGVKFHSVETTKLSLNGTAMPSGARYQNEQQQMREENGTFDFDVGGLAPYESTSTMTMLLIRQGDTPRLDDFFTRIIGHVTYTANGVPTVGRTTVDVFCR